MLNAFVLTQGSMVVINSMSMVNSKTYSRIVGTRCTRLSYLQYFSLFLIKLPEVKNKGTESKAVLEKLRRLKLTLRYLNTNSPKGELTVVSKGK